MKLGVFRMIIERKEAEDRALLLVADLMLAAARTAPKGRGVDDLVSIIVTGDEKKDLVNEMRKMADEYGEKLAFFYRDAVNIENAGAVVIFGTRKQPMGLSACGYCGWENCKSLTEAGGVCALNSINLGIALGSATSVAANHRVDNRIMFSAGRAAIKLNLFGEEVVQAFAIPLSITSKNPFYDRNM